VSCGLCENEKLVEMDEKCEILLVLSELFEKCIGQYVGNGNSNRSTNSSEQRELLGIFVCRRTEESL
jgi:hypothetical protein